MNLTALGTLAVMAVVNIAVIALRRHHPGTETSGCRCIPSAPRPACCSASI